MRGRTFGRLIATLAAGAALLLGLAGTASASTHSVAHPSSAGPQAVGANLTSATLMLDNVTSTSVDTQLTIQLIDVNGRVVAQAIGFFGQIDNATIALKVRPNVKWESLVGGAIRFASSGDGTLTFGYGLGLEFSDGDFSETAENRVVLDPAHRVHVHPLQFAV